jgi:hypothetical protein
MVAHTLSGAAFPAVFLAGLARFLLGFFPQLQADSEPVLRADLALVK